MWLLLGWLYGSKLRTGLINLSQPLQLGCLVEVVFDLDYRLVQIGLVWIGSDWFGLVHIELVWIGSDWFTLD